MVNRFDEGGFRGFGSPGLFGGFGGAPPFRGFGGSDSSGKFFKNVREDTGRSFFDQNPNIGFETSLNQAGLPRNMVDFFRGKAGKFLADYNAALGRRFLETGENDLDSLKFFQGIDFRKEGLKFSPKVRGEGIALQNPRTLFFN